MDLQNLTKKNQEFVHIATHQLIKDGKTDAEIKAILEEVLPNIIENQKKGLTARYLYGAPTVWAASFTEKTVNDTDSSKSEKNTNPWLMWLDTSLLFIAVVALLNAVMMFFSSSTVTTGIVSLIMLGFGGGAAMFAAYYFIYRHAGKPKSERPGWFKSGVILIGAMLIWVLIYTATGFLPEALNPQLPSYVLLIIGAAAFGLRYYLQKKYNIMNAMSPQQLQK